MIERITIAALLHDIGKFYQRGQENIQKGSELYKKYENLMTLICPEMKGGYLGYKHAFWTFKFFEDNKTYFKELSQVLDLDYDQFMQSREVDDNLINLAIYHHNPHSELQALIQMADWWSSGLDRRKTSLTWERDSVKYGGNAYRKRRLETLFQNISIKYGKRRSRYAYDLFPLSLNKSNIFPRELEEDMTDEILTDKYKELYEQFIKEFKKVPNKNPRAFLDTLDCLLQKYTWCIPSSTQGMSNVSLYSHLKTTAGLAACIYEFKKEKEAMGQVNDYFDYHQENRNRLVLKSGCPVLLTCIDISGIQSFIYNISSNKAAVSLKGRSYYLHLLMDTVIGEVLKNNDINLSKLQVIYSSGGKAYLFLPNTTKVKNALDGIESALLRALWDIHKDSLYVCIGTVPFRYDFQMVDDKYKSRIIAEEDNKEVEVDMGELWKLASEAAARKKHRRFEQVITNDENGIFTELFGENNKGIELKEPEFYDAVTGAPVYEVGKSLEGDDGLKISENTEKQVQLGRVLKDVDFVFSFTQKHKFEEYYTDSRLKLSIRPLELSTGYHLFDDENLADNDAEFRRIVSSSDVHCSAINRTDFMSLAMKGDNASYGYSFYGGNKQPENSKNERKTFHDLVKKDGKDTKLGILRMDVDNLGTIFIKGLESSLKTFSAYATLSAQLDLFFSGYINIIREKEKYKDYISILYSGGDDVFAVGRWDLLLDFGIEVRTAFKEFTTHNPDFDLSTGFVRTGAKFPISKGAAIAGDAESNAKNFTRFIHDNDENKGNRAAINLFGESVGWEEWEKVEQYKELLNSIIDQGGGKSILHRLQSMKLMKDAQNTPGTERDYSYVWRTLYYLERYTTRHIKLKNEIEKINKIVFIDKQSRNIDLMAIAARWVELLN